MSGPRHAAWSILRSGSTTPLREVDGTAAHYDLDDRDRGLLRRLVGTEVRRRATLRAIVQEFVDGKPNADVATHLRLGVAQLLFLDKVPPHAAVSESVRATSDTVSLSRGRYVNGVLRSVQRALRPGHLGEPRRDVPGADFHFTRDVFRDPEEHPLLWMEDAYSMPSLLTKRWRKRLGEEATRSLVELGMQEAPLSIVCLKGERDELAASFDFETQPGLHERILTAPASATRALVSSEAFQAGHVTIQGESALRAAELCQAGEGERVLELCAAPGGKTAILAATGARVFATDLSARRLAPMQANLERLGGGAVHAAALDGTAALREDARFDAVFIDAPCTNTGVLAARPGARWRFGPASVKELSNVQAHLLASGAKHVAPGGRLVYSVCSIEPEEGSRRVKAFLEEASGWTLEEELASLPKPEAGPVDGGYAARIRRSS